MKRIIFSLCLVAVVATGWAKPVSKMDAFSFALNAKTAFCFTLHPEVANVYFDIDAQFVDITEQLQVENLYVFNYRDCGIEGFVILSGDDIAAPVLAISDDGQLDPNNMAPAAREMLRQYDRQIDAARKQGVQATPAIAKKWADLDCGGDVSKAVENARWRKGDMYNDIIPDLLGNMRWGQGKPYNNLCPGGSVTGCVATAFGMIMNYWNWPEHGFGMHSYNGEDHPAAYPDWSYGVQSADFEHTYYDWDHIPDYVVINSDQAEIDAVSTLLYQIGVSLDMHYSPDGSGCWSLPEYAIFDTSLHLDASYGADTRIPKHFGYKFSYAGMRDSVGDDSLWIAMLYTSLKEGKPIYYAGWEKENNEAGHSATAGHGYILDGYFSDETDSNFFHINWGWSGSSNGYFKLDAMTPSGMDFTQWHGAFIGIEPDTAYHGYDYLGIAPVSNSGAVVYSHDGRICVKAAEGEMVEVYDMMGRRVAAQRVVGCEWSTKVRSGVYIVCVGHTAGKKVAVL